MIVLCCMHVAAQDAVPGDLDGDKTVSGAELCTAILTYPDGSVHVEQNDLRDAAHIRIQHPRAIIDSIGHNIMIYRSMKRIIAPGNYRTEAVKIFRASERIVGIADDILKYDYYYPELLEKPTIGTWSKPDYAAILSLSPDIVYFVTWFHPQFDLDPAEVYREYLERFMDVKYPEDMTFAYPSR